MVFQKTVLMVTIKNHVIFILTLIFFSATQLMAKTTDAANQEQEINEPMYKPFIERYILDELKAIRKDQQAMKAETAEKVAEAKLSASDRAIRYTTDTTNNIFYIITAAASILLLLGWKSIKDIKDNIVIATYEKVTDLTKEYEARLNELETSIKERSEQIMTAQQEIADTNMIHSLWMRVGLAKSEQEKIKLYDQILEINVNDVEALTYKADTLLDINEETWALSLTNQAIELDKEYALAYWQRGCAKAKLGQENEAIADIAKAIGLSESLKDEVEHEVFFNKLKSNKEFSKLLSAI